MVDHLEKMLEALDRSRADEVERIIVQQKKEQKQLGDLADKIARLQENIEAAKKIGDPQQRADQLKKLGEELQDAAKGSGAKRARDLTRPRPRKLPTI